MVYNLQISFVIPHPTILKIPGLVLRQLVSLTVPGVSGGKKPVSIIVKRILENSTLKFPLDNLLELC